LNLVLLDINVLCLFQLPGRTDNEIKNFWNTRIKKTEKQGLPIYPEHVLSQVKQPQQDMNCETPGLSHGKKRIREIEIHDLMDVKILFQHLDYHKDLVVPTKPLKRRASIGSLKISGETKETYCSTDLNYVLARSESVPTGSAIASGYPVELPSIQSSSSTLSNDWLLQCVSASVEQQIHSSIQSTETISSQTTGLLPTMSEISFETLIPMVYPMIHSFGYSEHESSPNTDIQAANLSLGKCA
jgi:transcription factor MYB, plant